MFITIQSDVMSEVGGWAGTNTETDIDINTGTNIDTNTETNTVH